MGDHLGINIGRIALVYGGALAALVFILKFIEYKFIVRDMVLEFYIGAIALIFTSVGIWAGWRIAARKRYNAIFAAFKLDENNLKRSGISKREYEVLALMARGYSNQEIADRMYLSHNTIKTHSASLFSKLNANRRTQAIEKARKLELIP